MANFIQLLMVCISTLIVAVTSLRVRNCYEYNSLPIELRQFQLSPSRIHIPGTTSLNFETVVYEDVGTLESPLNVRVTLERILRVGSGWFSMSYGVPVPCMDIGDGTQVGSCDYEDVCTMITQLQNQTDLSAHCADAESRGFLCSCPIPANRYSTGNSPLILNAPEGINVEQLPPAASLLLEGEYEVMVEIRSHLEDAEYHDGLLGCFSMDFEISLHEMASGLSRVTIR